MLWGVLALAIGSPTQLAVFPRLVATESSTVTVTDVGEAATDAARWFLDVQLVPRDRMRTNIEDELRACGTDLRCAAARLKQSGVQRGMYVILNQRTRPYVVTALIIDAAREETVASASTELSGSVLEGVGAASRQVLKAGGHVLGGRVRFDVEPPDATIHIDGAPASTPAWRPAGAHEVLVTADDHAPYQEIVHLEPGADVLVTATLSVIAPVHEKWWFWTIIGAAAVVAAAAVAVPISISAAEVHGCAGSFPECEAM